MQLIERYIQAVKFWLPKAQQDDIAAELHANLLSQAEDREAELGCDTCLSRRRQSEPPDCAGGVAFSQHRFAGAAARDARLRGD